MFHYTGRRLLQIIPVFFGATFLILAMVYLVPGDPVAALGGDRGLPKAAAAQTRAQYNLNKPFWMQYLPHLKGVSTPDFGTAFNSQKVTSIMATALPATARLAIYAPAIETFLGIGLGVVVGMRRDKWFDSTILVVSLLSISVPIFVLGFALQYVLGVQLVTLPTTASASVDIRSLTMPAMVLGGVSLVYVIRLTHQFVSKSVSVDYVCITRVKSLPGGVVMTRHILCNFLIPVATLIGGDLGALMGGAIATEGIFSIHGVGGTLWNAIIKGEPQTAMSVTTVPVLVYIIVSLIVDLLYAVLDPRIRYE